MAAPIGGEEEEMDVVAGVRSATLSPLIDGTGRPEVLPRRLDGAVNGIGGGVRLHGCWVPSHKMRVDSLSPMSSPGAGDNTGSATRAHECPGENTFFASSPSRLLTIFSDSSVELGIGDYHIYWHPTRAVATGTGV